MRLFSLAMLRTEYVLALILAVMLFGMGLGSLIASRRSSSRLMAVLPWCASGCAIAGLWLLPAFSGWIERTNFNSLRRRHAGQGLSARGADAARDAFSGGLAAGIVRQDFA